MRGFILGRMSYDPTLPPNGAGVHRRRGQMMSNGAFTSAGSPTGFSTFSNTRGPATLLDQMWIRFDVLEHVFVTAGKQHVHWGTGRFWQPTDYLHQQKRNPLDVFDARAGDDDAEAERPLGGEGVELLRVRWWPRIPTPPRRRCGKVAGAFRVEAVMAGVELGADTYLRRGQKPRYGFDFSTGIWDFDVYGDVAIRPGGDFLHEFPAQSTMPAGTLQLHGYETQAVGGINYSRKYNDNDVWTAGVEYFYNHPGYDNASAYPALLQAAFLTATRPRSPSSISVGSTGPST